MYKCTQFTSSALPTFVKNPLRSPRLLSLSRSLRQTKCKNNFTDTNSLTNIYNFFLCVCQLCEKVQKTVKNGAERYVFNQQNISTSIFLLNPIIYSFNFHCLWPINAHIPATPNHPSHPSHYMNPPPATPSGKMNVYKLRIIPCIFLDLDGVLKTYLPNHSVSVFFLNTHLFRY